MEPITRDMLAGNAYRTLGVGASATQAEIDVAARRLRIWPDGHRAPATPWDVAWLGPVRRGRGEVERAVATLNEPGSRVEQRLLWYHAAPVDAAGRAAAAAEGESPLRARHDGVLRGLLAAVVRDPHIRDVAEWREIVAGVAELAASAEYASWIAGVESAGDFEKRASAGEVSAAIGALPVALTWAMVPKAVAALDAGEVAAAANIAGIIRGAAGGEAAVGVLLDRIEDALERQCKAMDAELRDKLRTDDDAPAGFYWANRVACASAARVYEGQVAVALARFCELARDDADRLTRARSRCAGVLALLAIGWEWSGEFGEAARAQRVALRLAAGTAGEAEMRRELERYEALAARDARTALGGLFVDFAPNTVFMNAEPADTSTDGLFVITQKTKTADGGAARGEETGESPGDALVRRPEYTPAVRPESAGANQGPAGRSLAKLFAFCLFMTAALMASRGGGGSSSPRYSPYDLNGEPYYLRFPADRLRLVKPPSDQPPPPPTPLKLPRLVLPEFEGLWPTSRPASSKEEP